MNKLIKGSIAGAAGIALLLGGAGTFASWNDSAAVAAGSVTSGVLDVSNAVAGTWDKNIALIVPGDTRTFSDSLEVTATGDNLSAKVTTNAASIVNKITDATVNTVVTLKNASTSAVITPVDGVFTVGAGTYTVDVSIVVTFPSTVGGQNSQNKTTDLSGLAVTVAQVLPTTP